MPAVNSEAMSEHLAEISRRVTAGAHAMVAVSYTHLRAHETVLDLVCRLLLETKKTYNTKCAAHTRLRYKDASMQSAVQKT